MPLATTPLASTTLKKKMNQKIFVKSLKKKMKQKIFDKQMVQKMMTKIKGKNKLKQNPKQLKPAKNSPKQVPGGK